MRVFVNVGGMVLLLYWTVHTLRIALTPRINTRMKAIKFDLNTGDEETKTQAKRNFRLIKVAVGVKMGRKRLACGYRRVGTLHNRVICLCDRAHMERAINAVNQHLGRVESWTGTNAIGAARPCRRAYRFAPNVCGRPEREKRRFPPRRNCGT